MARELKYKDLIEILSTKCYVSEVTAERFMENLVLLIANELQNNSYLNIKNIGKFSVERKGGCDEWIQNELGTMVKKYVEPFDYVNFEPSQNLLDVVNGESLNYLFKKTKEKYDKPTPFEDIVTEQQQKDLTPEIAKILSKKKNRKERKKENKDFNPNSTFAEYNKNRQRPILCKNNNVIYPSINRAAIELGLKYTTLKEHTYGRIKDMKCNGYEFEWVIENNNEEERGK